MAKKPKKKKKLKPIHELYKDGKRNQTNSCPKCGPGYFLAEHKKRRVCGKCKYVETKS